MAKRFFEYGADDSTFDLNVRDLGIVPEGVYCGFDEISFAPEFPTFNDKVAVKILHSQTGMSLKYPNGGTDTNIGIINTKQGVRIWESTNVICYITPTVSPEIRYDAITLRHTYNAVSGGTQHVYEAIEGTSTSYPTQIPSDSILIGYVKVSEFSLEWQRANRADELPFKAISKSKIVSDKSEIYVGTQVTPASGSLPSDVAGNYMLVNAGQLNFLPKQLADIAGNYYMGRSLILYCSGNVTFYSRAELEDMGVTNPPIGQNWQLSISSETVIPAGTMLRFLETEDGYRLLHIEGPTIGAIRNATQLQNKQVWGLETGFRTAVKSAVQNTLINSWEIPSYQTPPIVVFRDILFNKADDGILKFQGHVKGFLSCFIPLSGFSTEMQSFYSVARQFIIPYVNRTINVNNFVELQAEIYPQGLRLFALNGSPDFEYFFDNLTIRYK